MRIVVPSRCFRQKVLDDIDRVFVCKQIFDADLFELPCCIESILDLIAYRSILLSIIEGIDLETNRGEELTITQQAAVALTLHNRHAG